MVGVRKVVFGVSARAQARILALVVALAGVLTLATSVRADLAPRLVSVRDVLTPYAAGIANGLTALLGIALLLVGKGLFGRRRLALWGGIVTLLMSSGAHLLEGADVAGAAVTALLAWLLWRRREIFVADPGPARWRSLVGALPFVVLVDYAYGLLGLILGPDPDHPKLTPVRAVQEVTERLVGAHGPLHFHGFFATWFPASVSVVGIGSLVVLLFWALAPVADRFGNPSAAERAELTPMVFRPGAGTLDPFILRGDKRHVFSADRKAAIGYRYLTGVGLGSGDPVGDPASWESAIEEFLTLCDVKGWRPAVYGVRGDVMEMYEKFGMKSIYVGDEAVVDVQQFSLEGRRMRNVRQAVSRTKNFGLTCTVHREGELSAELRAELRRISEIDNGKAGERGFAMGLDAMLSGRDKHLVVLICRDANGRPVAFQRYATFGLAEAGLSLDAMRRLPDCPNGVNERMIVEAIEWGKPRGVTELSLNFAAFRSVFDREKEKTALRSLEQAALRTLEPLFQLEQLYRFNGKFFPRWVPRHVAYRTVADIPAVGIAAMAAEQYIPIGRGATREGEQRTLEHAGT
ncbi:MAG TPA: phosphatidylglycerol lysyltransferase domain-containing protein [Mycobacteriales bacterium]|nr:phosphatidylglycerol lysyltransferase domain-containing protein [Mycobacteriales bacterium]